MTAIVHALARAVKVQLLAPASRSATAATPTAVDLLDYEGTGIFCIESAAGTGTAPTANFTLEDSPDNVTFTAVTIPGGAFTQVTNAAASSQERYINVSELQRYVRVPFTLGGSGGPAFICSSSFVGQKKYQS